jgi:hypothetical protein
VISISSSSIMIAAPTALIAAARTCKGSRGVQPTRRKREEARCLGAAVVEAMTEYLAHRRKVLLKLL